MELLFLGDLIDRGRDSAAVLRRVHGLWRNGAGVILGNHEETFLQFLGGDARATLRFAYNGGAETVESFVRELGRPFPHYSDLREFMERDGLYTWLNALPHHVCRLGISATHAPVHRQMWSGGMPPRAASLWSSPQDADDPADWGQYLWAENGLTPVCGHIVTPHDGSGRRNPVRAGLGYFLDCGCGDEPDCELVASVFEGGNLIESIRSR
jgi:hypothetical protein